MPQPRGKVGKGKIGRGAGGRREGGARRSRRSDRRSDVIDSIDQGACPDVGISRDSAGVGRVRPSYGQPRRRSQGRSVTVGRLSGR
eukprot:2350406-Pyramimonas_sp.AAC.1